MSVDCLRSGQKNWTLHRLSSAVGSKKQAFSMVTKEDTNIMIGINHETCHSHLHRILPAAEER